MTGFEDADMDGEQRIEWGNVYSKYVDWLEEQLDQFCESEGCTVEEVFEKLKECMTGENSNFMPVFMQNTEYAHFLKQVRYYANNKKTREQVKDACEVKKDKERRKSTTACVNFSGHWVVDQSYDHKKKAQAFMEAAGTPWIYRKIFSHAATSKYLNLFIEQDGDKTIRFVYRFKFFGGNDHKVTFGEEIKHKNPWNADIRSILTLDKKKRMMNSRAIKGPPHLPKGSTMRSSWKMGEYEETLNFSRFLTLKDGTEFTSAPNSASSKPVSV